MPEQQVLTVNGMTCDGCERRITSALGEVSGVEDVSADHDSGTVTVRFDPAVASAQSVHGTIEGLGYQVVV